MIAIILSAGTGSRLRPLTEEIPKPLLMINGMTLLERMVRNIIKNGCEDFLIVVGHKKEKVQDEVQFLHDKYDINIATVENPNYDTTNTSVSVRLATKKVFDDDVIIINGDNVIDEKIITGLLETPQTTLVIDNYKKLNEESFKLEIKDNQITQIGKQIPISSSSGEFIGISKVNKKDLELFNKNLDTLIEQDKQNYYDLAYKKLSTQTHINYFYTDGLKWTEIDDLIDWEYANELIEEFDKTEEEAGETLIL